MFRRIDIPALARFILLFAGFSLTFAGSALAAEPAFELPAGAPAAGDTPGSAAMPQAAPTTPLPAAKPRGVRVSMQTSVGTLLLELDRDHAPITTANFLRYVREKRFDGMTFYRAMNIAPGYGLIQGGTSAALKRTLPPVKHEPTTLTGLSHVDGALSMARGAPGTAAGDFFITIGTLTALDAKPEQAGDNLGYAVFGRVVDGMETVQRILQAKISATKGVEAGMQGQMIDMPVKIISARILAVKTVPAKIVPAPRLP